MKRLLAVVLAASTLSACGGEAPPDDAASAPSSSSDWPALDLTPEPGFDPDDPALQTIPDDDAHVKALLAQAGDRRDFKVPAKVVSGLEDGPLVLAVVTRPFNELAGEEARQLNPGQRAVYAMYLADFEVLNGGFSQFWLNVPPSLTNDMVKHAERLGSPEFTAIFRDGQALWPGGKIPRDPGRLDEVLATLDGDKLAAIDQRYAETQYMRRTALGTVLGRYIRANTDEFVAG